MCLCPVAFSCSRCDVVNLTLQIRRIGRRSAVALSSPMSSSYCRCASVRCPTSTSVWHYIFVILVQGSIQMCPHCRLNIAYCYGLPTWIFGRNPWTNADQTFTICTPLLSRARFLCGGVGTTVLQSVRCWPPTKLSPHRCRHRRLNREDVEWAKYRSNNEALWHGAEAAML